MQMGAQPPARTVYQRALKPSPCVYFIVPALPAVESSQFRQLRLLRHTLDQPDVGGGVWVEAGLVDEQGNRLAASLDGITAVRLQKSGWHDGVYTATFKKIKLLVTSQQKAGSQFCLRFTLKCASLDLGPLGAMAVLSNPMAVFSHTQYLGGSSPGSSSTAAASSSSSSSPLTRKYAHNPVGLQLKVMEMIHACKVLGGSEEVLHQCVDAVFGSTTGTIPESLLSFRSTEPGGNPATTLSGEEEPGRATSGCPPATTTPRDPFDALAEINHHRTAATNRAHPLPTLFDAAGALISSAPSSLATHYAVFNNSNNHPVSSHLHSSADESTLLPPPQPTASHSKSHRGLDAPATTASQPELPAPPQLHPLLPSVSSAFHIDVAGPASLRGLLSLLCEKVASDSNHRKHPWPEGGASDHQRPPPSAKRRRTNVGARARSPDRPQR